MAESRAFRDGDLGFTVGPALTRITMFGEFSVLAPDGSAVSITNRRARAILAMISLDPERPIARETLTKLLWPGRFEAQAKASLRQCLLELGKLLDSNGCAILSITRDRVGLLADRVQTDLVELDQALAAGDVDLAHGILTQVGSKPLLDQLQISDGFDKWLRSHRDEVASRIDSKIAEAVERLKRAGNVTTATKLDDARSNREAPKPVSVRADLAQDRTRLAVLPFQAIGANDGSDYFADGMVDELISTLSQVPQLQIAGRTSSFHFRNSDLTPTTIAAALSVSHLVEGSVQRQGEKVRIHVRLIEGERGFEHWGQRFDGTLDDVFALQETVAQAVTLAIGGALGVAMQEPLVHGLTCSKKAYDLYLQGRALNAKLFGDGVLTRAAELLEEAVKLDPKFAEAWLLLGDVRQRMGIYIVETDQTEASTIMAECVREALAIKPNLGFAYGLLALHELTRNNIVGCLDLAFKGYDVEPHNPAVAVRLGGLLLFCGLTRRGMRYLDEAIAQDPADGRNYMMRSTGHFNSGNIDAAIADGQRCVDLGFPSMWLGVAHAAAGHHDVAIEHYQQTRLLLNNSIPPPAGIAPMSPKVMDAYWLVAAKGVCSGRAEDRETYCRTLDYLHATMIEKEHMAITLPAIFMGYADMLFKTIGTRITLSNLGCLMSMWADVDPIRQIWQHPEFIPFAQRIGMATAWDKYGWPDILPMPTNQ